MAQATVEWLDKVGVGRGDGTVTMAELGEALETLTRDRWEGERKTRGYAQWQGVRPMLELLDEVMDGLIYLRLEMASAKVGRMAHLLEMEEALKDVGARTILLLRRMSRADMVTYELPEDLRTARLPLPTMGT